MRIGSIGAGSMGEALACHLARPGQQVSIANSMGLRDLTVPAAGTGAAKGKEIVVLSIPSRAVADLPRGLCANAPGSVGVIDIGNYHPELRDGRIDAIDRSRIDEYRAEQEARLRESL